MANLPAGVSMVDSIVQWSWMNLMHSGFNMAGKLVFFIVIEDSFPLVTLFRQQPFICTSRIVGVLPKLSS
jgi:hypothetical protein